MAIGEMTDADKVMNPQHFESDPADIQKSEFESEIMFVKVRHLGGSLHSLSTVYLYVFYWLMDTLLMLVGLARRRL